jgi:plasmid stabilization system protein ParE
MAFKLIWSPSARLDVKDIADFIADDSPSAAQRFIRSLFEVVERLADFPESGRMVPEFGDPTIREVIRRPCRIVYRVDKKKRKVEIARVWHAARGTPEIY